MSGNRQREQGEAVAAQLRLGWRERLKREKEVQREESKAAADAATRMPALADTPAGRVLARKSGGPHLESLLGQADELAYECKDCRDIGLVLLDRKSETTGPYVASKPCECRRGRQHRRVFDKWHSKKKGGAEAPPRVPAWIDEPWD